MEKEIEQKENRINKRNGRNEMKVSQPGSHPYNPPLS